jgi:hypothetical protein
MRYEDGPYLILVTMVWVGKQNELSSGLPEHEKPWETWIKSENGPTLTTSRGLC